MSTADAYIAYTHRFFRKWLPVYDLFAGSIFYAYGAAVERVAPCAGQSVLDVCTGTGEIALRCARRGARVTGIDVTPAMLEKARKKAVGLDGVSFSVMDARHLELPDRAFDVAVISFALHDMPRRVRLQVLREASRVARQRLVILDYDFPARPPLLREALVRMVRLFETAYLKGFADEGVAPLLAEVGLRASESRKVVPLFRVHVVSL